jgi:hypothetical protein
MQTRLLFFAVQVALLAVLLMGCTSPGSLTKPAATSSTDKRWISEAERIGVTEKEIAEVVRIATERYRLVIAWVQKADGGGIAVYLADKPTRAHGIVVVFRKIDGRWQEDPKSKDGWII